ncbi:PIG-L deacetylase family protein [Roseivivax sediminis]|uniref:N-acetylglucosaminyl deacetylase, LmbE family n=1 Tax=Roseivivax sediminis TaxID=936889 RepID=A0A1I1W031_9RHOB|nr:PIG-L family deacetylase [Roseivivax sediminis]SFD88534.1 N-acetylglucosaminyl deacetylase, LmbE family [Roseivivax sediminis]
MTPDITPGGALPDCIAKLLDDGPIVVLTPHPDDNAFGCGALLSHAFARNGAHVICMGEGAHSGRNGGHPAPRPGEIELAMAHLGGRADDVTALRRPCGWPDQRDTFAMLATHVGTIARAIGARRIFSTAVISDNADHRATAEIAERATSMYGLELYHYAVWSRWTEATFGADGSAGIMHRLPVGEAAAAKGRALASFRSRFDALAKGSAHGAGLPQSYRDRFLTGDEVFFAPSGISVLAEDVHELAEEDRDTALAEASSTPPPRADTLS